MSIEWTSHTVWGGQARKPGGAKLSWTMKDGRTQVGKEESQEHASQEETRGPLGTWQFQRTRKELVSK